VEELAQRFQAAQGGLGLFWLGFGEACQALQVLLQEPSQEPRPIEQGAVAEEPVLGRPVPSGDRVDQVEGQVAGDQVLGGEAVLDDFHAWDLEGELTV
jgi:hypothetical protein